MKFFVVLVLSVAASGCSRFVDWDAPFVAFNSSNDDVVVVYGGSETRVPANRSVAFTITVAVPKPPVGMTGPSTVDQRVQINLAFRNLRTGQLTQPIYCQAGAKVVTNVWYELSPSGRETTRCSSSY